MPLCSPSRRSRGSSPLASVNRFRGPQTTAARRDLYFTARGRASSADALVEQGDAIAPVPAPVAVWKIQEVR